MPWCQGSQNIGLSNHELKSALKCTVWSQWTPVPDGHTDRETDGRSKLDRLRYTRMGLFHGLVRWALGLLGDPCW